MHPLLKRATRAGLSRRDFLRNLLFTAGSVSAATWLTACGGGGSSNRVTNGRGEPAPMGNANVANLGPLQAPDENGIMLPEGFTSRVVAVSNEPPVAGQPFLWHQLPDGGNTAALMDGGWVYVSNAESRDATSAPSPPGQPIVPRTLSPLLGGASALRFSADGTLTEAYTILENTTTNCSGVITPWGTWICGEEIGDGLAFECDVLGGNTSGTQLDALGRFGHEQMAVDEANRTIYHTEDFGGEDRFYRTVFTETDWPTGQRPQLMDGTLQVLVIEGGPEAALDNPAGIRWVDAIGVDRPQRENYQPETAILPGNEGCWFFRGIVFFTTKDTGTPATDNTVWAIDTTANTIERIYAPDLVEDPILTGVDNITVTEDGDIFVVEDGGNMQVVALTATGQLLPFLQLADMTGQSEVTGPAFSPDGRRFYCSAQRSGRNGTGGFGITFEITMPFAVNVNRPMAAP